LRALAPSSIAVTVLGPGDAPIAGARVRATRRTRIGARLPGPVLTDEAGRARVSPLGSGVRTVEVQLEGAREWVGDTDVDLVAGQESQATIRLSKRDLPRLAVAGRVVDEDGAALPDVGVSVEVEGGAREFLITDEGGAFELSTSRAAERVTVRAGASIFGDRFEPAALEVPFGTRGVEIRRTEALEDVFVLFELVDAGTGAPIPDSADPAIIVYRRPGPDGRVHAVARFGPTNGVTEVDFHPHDDLDWFVVAPGYREARGTIDLPEPDGTPTVHRVVLERGFARALTVRDASTGAPLAGAKVVDGGGATLGTTAGDGFVQLLGATWPEGALTVHRDGYAPTEWDPAFYWSHHDGAVWLDRM
jgi:hypothetical protein